MSIGDTSDIGWEPWIQTRSGKKFHFNDQNIDEVLISDIATVLSRVPRWAGHTDKFYSVAQHSVIVSMLVGRRGGDVAEQLHGLLHDATEAYMSDIPSPLKRLIPQFKEIETKVWAKISCRFFGYARENTQLIHDCDVDALLTESRDLMGHPPIDNWTSLCNGKAINDFIVAQDSETARLDFLRAFTFLSSEMNK